MLILFAGLGAILKQPAIMQEVDQFIDQVVPIPDASEFIKEFVVTRVQAFTAYRHVVGAIGTIGLLIAATGLFSSLRTILGVVFQSDTEESILRGKLRDIGFVMLVLVFFLLSVTVLPSLNVIEDYADQIELLRDFRLETLQEFALEMISLALIFIGFFVVYFTVPHERAPVEAIFVAAFWASILWKAAEIGFGYYLSNFITYQQVWGTYALLVAVALWSYYTSIVFIVGAEIGQLYRERHDMLPPSSVRHDGPSRFFRD
jgi:membrane protein